MHVHVRVPVSVPHIIHSLLVLVCAMSVEAKNTKSLPPHTVSLSHVQMDFARMYIGVCRRSRDRKRWETGRLSDGEGKGGGGREIARETLNLINAAEHHEEREIERAQLHYDQGVSLPLSLSSNPSY